MTKEPKPERYIVIRPRSEKLKSDMNKAHLMVKACIDRMRNAFARADENQERKII